MSKLYAITGLLVGLVFPAFLSKIFFTEFFYGLFAVVVLFIAIRTKQLPVFMCLTGFAISSFTVYQKTSNQLPENHSHKHYAITAKITDLPKITADSTRFYARVVAVDNSKTQFLVNKKIRLSWRGHSELTPGEHWSLRVKLKRPRGFANPKGFDYQLWLLQNNVYATGYVVTKKGTSFNHRLAQTSIFEVDSIRYSIASYVNNLQLINGAIFNALLLGDKQAVSQSQWDLFNRTGTIHLMAISGLHIGLVASLAFLIGRIVSPIFSALLSAHAIRLVPVILSVLCATSYAILSGLSIPTQRALIFIALFSYCYLFNKRVSIFNVILVAAVIVIFVDPLAATQRGFWLSFAAVLVLSILFANRVRRVSFINSLIYAQFGIFIGLIFPLAVLGLNSSVISPLVNMIVVPIFSFLFIPLLFIALILSGIIEPWGRQLFNILDLSLDFVLNILRLFAENTHLINLDIEPNLFSFLSAILGTLLLLLPRVFNVTIIGLCFLIVGIIGSIDESQSGASVSILDVGQGLAVVARSRDQTLVYDFGARYNANFDLGSLVVAPFLLNHGVKQIDLAIVSHGDNDHIGGFNAVANNLPVKQLVAETLKDEIEPYASVWKKCSGLSGHLGALEYQVLWPDHQIASFADLQNENNRSCVLLLKYNDLKILLLGDIEAEVEHRLIANGVLPRDVYLVVASHHGSKTSSTYSLIQQLNAQHVVFSAGYKNRYNHPHPDVVNRFAESGARIWNTSLQGAITLDLSEEADPQVWSYREQFPRVWH